MTAKDLQRGVVDRAKVPTTTAKPLANAQTSDGANLTLTAGPKAPAQMVGPKAKTKRRKTVNAKSMAIARTSATPIAIPMQNSDATTDVVRALAETAAIQIQGAAPTGATADRAKVRQESKAGIAHPSGGAERIQAMPNKLFAQ
jgi:hypothetical protein